MADQTMTNPNQDAAQNVPPAFVGQRTLLALDLGTTTGWALHGADGLITSGTASFRNGRFDGGGMRYLRFTNWLGELERLSGPSRRSGSRRSVATRARMRPTSMAV